MIKINLILDHMIMEKLKMIITDLRLIFLSIQNQDRNRYLIKN